MGLLTTILPKSLIRWLNAELRGTSDDRFSRVFHASPDWIVITRLSDSLIVEANQGFESVSGYTAREAIGHCINEFNIWVHAHERVAIVAQLQRDGVVRNAPAKSRRKDGVLRDVEISAILISVDGPAHSHAVWIARDVTDAKTAAEHLRISEARFALLFAQSPLPMCYANGANQFATTQWNDAWFATFGFDAETCQGKSGDALKVWVNPQDRQKIMDLVPNQTSYLEMEAPMRRADGAIRLVAVTTRLFSQTEFPMLVSSYVDITEREESRKKIEALNAQLENRVAERTAELQASNRQLYDTVDALNQTKDQLVQSEKLAALGALVAGIAHELNTPIGNGLTVASSLEHRVEKFSEMLDAGMRRSDLQSFVDETRMAAEIITRNLSRAGHLVSSFKQVAVDQTSSQRRTFELGSVVSEILLTLGAVIKKARCHIAVDVPANMLLESYPGPLGQVLANLVTNALVHAFESDSSGDIVIHAELQAGGKFVELSVRDNGLGIAPENQRRIFDPFFTTRLGQGGSGLGLHIVHNIVGGVLGGRIKVQSTPGEGAEFCMTLPVVAPQHPQA